MTPIRYDYANTLVSRSAKFNSKCVLQMNAGDIADLSRMTLNNDGLMGSSISAPFSKESDNSHSYDPFPALPKSDRLGSHPHSMGSSLLTPQMIQTTRPNSDYSSHPSAVER